MFWHSSSFATLGEHKQKEKANLPRTVHTSHFFLQKNGYWYFFNIFVTSEKKLFFGLK